MAALNYIGLSGAVIYMFAHAMATGMLFAMAGWVYDQTHTRDIPSLGGLANRMCWSHPWKRAQKLPKASTSPRWLVNDTVTGVVLTRAVGRLFVPSMP